MILLTLLYIALNIYLAKIDANKIAKDLVINHFNNGLHYGLMVLASVPLLLLSMVIFKNLSYNIFDFAQIVFSLLLTRKIVFDIGLNLFRGKDWDYISLTTTSKIDQFENKIFGTNGAVKYSIYILLHLTNIVLYLI